MCMPCNLHTFSYPYHKCKQLMANGGTAMIEYSCEETLNNAKQLRPNAFFDSKKRQVAYAPC